MLPPIVSLDAVSLKYEVTEGRGSMWLISRLSASTENSHLASVLEPGSSGLPLPRANHLVSTSPRKWGVMLGTKRGSLVASSYRPLSVRRAAKLGR